MINAPFDACMFQYLHCQQLNLITFNLQQSSIRRLQNLYCDSEGVLLVDNLTQQELLLYIHVILHLYFKCFSFSWFQPKIIYNSITFIQGSWKWGNSTWSIDQFGFKNVAAAILGGGGGGASKSMTKDDAMTQAYTCSWTKAGHSLKYSSFVMLLEAAPPPPKVWRTKRNNILETELVYISPFQMQ